MCLYTCVILYVLSIGGNVQACNRIDSLHIEMEGTSPARCTNGNVLCTEGSVLCANGNVLCTEGSVLCANGSALCANWSVLCANGSVLCLNTKVKPAATVNMSSRSLLYVKHINSSCRVLVKGGSRSCLVSTCLHVQLVQ
uniref:SRCR domain-containing protein n=1 Tax=Electrophorus electricus TaxID=8005 RepID=A0A4W4HTQ5_ELEEL